MNYTLVKKLLKLIIIVLTFLFVLFLIDLYLFRGYGTTSISCLFDIEIGEQIDTPQHLVYSIKKINKGEYELNFQNRSIYPYYFWTYRNEEVFQEISDTVFFNYASRRMINHPLYKTKYRFGVDCGTGIGLTSLNPFESFEIIFDKNKILEEVCWNIQSIYRNKDDDAFIDVLKREDLIEIEDGYVLSDRMISMTKDSLEVELYFPVFGYFKNELIYVSSNTFKVAYLDVLQYEIDKRNRYGHWKR